MSENPESKKRGWVVPAKAEHVIAIEVDGFRDIDNEECYYSAGTSAAEQCFLALENPNAETFTVMNEGHPVALFGVVPWVELGVEPGHGILWFLASPGLFEVKEDFMEQITWWLDWLQRYLPVCINYVSAKNTIALEWCAAVGFVVGEAVPYGLKGEPFHKVVRTCNSRT